MHDLCLSSTQFCYNDARNISLLFTIGPMVRVFVCACLCECVFFCAAAEFRGELQQSTMLSLAVLQHHQMVGQVNRKLASKP